MSHLAAWLQKHQNEVQTIVRQKITDFDIGRVLAPEFVQSLINAAVQSEAEPFHATFRKWFKAHRSSEQKNQQPILAILLTIQQDVYRYIRATLPAEKALDVLEESQMYFANASFFLSQLEIETRVNEIFQTLEQARHDTQRLDKHKADFISVASHELKTPLTLIEGYTNMLKSDFGETDHPRSSMMLNGISSGTRRLREIVEDLIDISMLDMKLMKFHSQPLWVKRLLDMVISEMSKVAGERQIQLAFERDSLPDASMYGDPERLYQVFEKVIENAIKYTPDGGQIKIFGRKAQNNIEIVIRDTGVGINPKDLHVIFEKFFSLGQATLHSSSKSRFKGGGPGLGLAIAKGIIEAHGGTIWAESDGHDEKRFTGSHFHISLPMRQVLTVERDPRSDDKTKILNHPALRYPMDEEVPKE